MALGQIDRPRAFLLAALHRSPPGPPSCSRVNDSQHAMQHSRHLAFLLVPCFLAAAAGADSLTLSVAGTIDISALPVGGCGDLAYDDVTNRLWIADGLPNGLIYAINATTGTFLGTRDPSVIPGLDQGPDALAVGPATTGFNLFVFSPFGENEGGRINQPGDMVADYNTGLSATGADFDAAEHLWVVSGTSVGNGAQLRRLATADAAIVQTVQITPTVTSRMSGLAFDPHTGACYVLAEQTNTLLEINLTTGNVVSTTNMAPFLIQQGQIVGGIEFDATGSRLFVCTGAQAGADSVVVLRRDFSPTICANGPGQSACPCNNAGLLDRGCENSFATGGGLIRSSGVPRVSSDTFGLDVLHLPPSTSCLFFQGTSIPSEILPFGDGSRCVAGAVIRLGTKTTVAGAAAYPTGGDPTIHVRGQIPIAGATRFYQAWYRNIAPFCTPSGFNLTNAVKVIWAP